MKQSPPSPSRGYITTDLNCGILEAKADANAESIHNKLIPGLALPLQVRASILADNHLPIVSVFTPGIYQAHEADEYKELLQAYDPILLEHPFITHRVEPRSNGTVYYFQATEPVIEHIKGKEYTLEYPLGQAIFHCRVEYETVDLSYLYRRLPLRILNQDPPPVAGHLRLAKRMTDPHGQPFPDCPMRCRTTSWRKMV